MDLAEISTSLANTATESGCAVVGVVANSSGEIQSFGAGEIDRPMAGKISASLAAMISRFIQLCSQGDGQIGVSAVHVQNPRETISPSQTLDLKTAAAYLQMSAFTLRGLAAAGIIPGAKIGRCWVFMQEKLADYLRAETDKQTAERSGSLANGANSEQEAKPIRRRRGPPPSLKI